ncbi:MAG: ABC transporter permease [Clostridia bacterium]|nr:ABC transporter permease [Clostridia bacterium]
MVIKNYFKMLFKTFGKHIARLLSLIVMVLISVGFVAGIGSAQDKIDYSLTGYYKSRNVSDYIIKSNKGAFTQDEISAVSQLFPAAEINTGMSVDIPLGDKRYLRVYFLDFENWTVNVPELIKGEKPSSAAHAYAERADDVIKGYSVGDNAEIDLSAVGLPVKFNVTVSGIVQSPLTFSKNGEPSYNNEMTSVPETTSGTKDMNCLENILYVSKDLLPAVGDIYVAVENRNVFKAFSGAYDRMTETDVKRIEEVADASVITLDKNYSFKSLSAYGEKVAGIGYVLMIAFLFVTALVTLSTMTRLLEEERPQIACLKTLGYSSFGIISKYVLFALVATGVGGGGGYFVGLGIAYFIYSIFSYSFNMPPVSGNIAIVFYIIVFSLIVAATVAATVISGFKLTGEHPANLLRPKPPRAGKKVFLERIPLLWNRLSFKYKSTMRNVFRYKSRFIMTVFAVAFSTALVLTGLALLDLCLFSSFGSPEIMGIAILIVVFAGLLTGTVIYTLTNINISERNREIATLMVLGYHNREVTGYIYREIYINSGIGIIFGYPVSLLFIWFVFSVIGQGTLAGISWFVWLIAPLFVLLFTFFVTLTLIRKIIKIDMNESLKAIE